MVLIMGGRGWMCHHFIYFISYAISWIYLSAASISQQRQVPFSSHSNSSYMCDHFPALFWFDWCSRWQQAPAVRCLRYIPTWRQFAKTVDKKQAEHPLGPQGRRPLPVRWTFRQPARARWARSLPRIGGKGQLWGVSAGQERRVQLNEWMGW